MPDATLQKNIIKELGIDQLPPEKQQEVLAAMTEAVLKRLTVRVLEKLPPEARPEFEKVCKTQDPEKITQFLNEKVPDFEKVAAKEIADFKEEIAETVNKLIS